MITTMKRTRWHYFLIVLLALAIEGCTGKPAKQSETEQASPKVQTEEATLKNEVAQTAEPKEARPSANAPQPK